MPAERKTLETVLSVLLGAGSAAVGSSIVEAGAVLLIAAAILLNV